MNNNFNPLDLSTESVKNIYLACRPTEKSTNVYSIIFQQKALGFSKDSTPLLLDVNSIEENISNIFFLFGQLKTVHLKSPFLPIKDILKKYDNTYWTKDKAAPMYLMHLGIAASVILPPDAQTKTSLMGPDVLPTFSPNDPLFNEWVKQYKPRIFKKTNGQEPADD